MPKHDGMGPAGKGPMTGRGKGYCILRIPDDKSKPLRGFSGMTGKPFALAGKSGKEVAAMPRGDRTGPTGFGPMTGRGAGFCRGYGAPGFVNAGAGWSCGGRGRGGGGLGRRNWYYATGVPGWQRAAWGYPGGAGTMPPETPSMMGISKEQELDMLKAQASQMEGMLENLKKRIEDLEPPVREQ